MSIVSAPKTFMRSLSLRFARTMSESKIPPSDNSTAPNMIRHLHKVGDFDRAVLKFSGHFKKKDIPDSVSLDTLQLARNKARIKLSNYLLAITAVVSVSMMYLGRKSAERGETLEKMNLDWHKDYNEATKATDIDKK